VNAEHFYVCVQCITQAEPILQFDEDCVNTVAIIRNCVRFTLSWNDQRYTQTRNGYLIFRRIIMNTFTSFLKDESGATAIEYGLIAALISVVAIIAMRAVGTNLSKTLNTVASSMK